MKLSLTSFFSQKTTSTSTDYIDKLKHIAQKKNLFFFSDVAIYHHARTYILPLIMFDPQRGLYLFEIKEWDYTRLQKANIVQEESSPAENTLAYHSMQQVIYEKLDELSHTRNLPIYNYLICTHLTSQEYAQLPETLQKYLPQNTIIFQDTKEHTIYEILFFNKKPLPIPLSTHTILGSLFIQYTFIKEDKPYFANKEQRAFIDTSLHSLTTLLAPPKSGATQTILLKAVVEILRAPYKKVLIIKPNTLSKDILQKQLIALIEHAIIEFDFTALEILTPQELIIRHLHKLKKQPFSHISLSCIEPSLMKKKFSVADIIFCDDVAFLDAPFIEYLKHIQKKKKLVLVNTHEDTYTFSLQHTYLPAKRKIYFYETNPLAKTMHLVASLYTQFPQDTILIVSSVETKEKLFEDMQSFVQAPLSCIDATQHLIHNTLQNILLASYHEIIDIEADHLIALDTSKHTKEELEYALFIASKNTYVVYEEETQSLQDLKEKYENNKDR